ncbi:MAG: transposase [Bryobacteraceae bacterium]
MDWADQKHFWTMRTAQGQCQRGELSNTPEAVEVWAAGLAQRFPGHLVALALEQARGAVIAMLSKYAHLALFPAHSTTLANYRTAFAPSGAKGDPSDADLILDLRLKHPDRIRRLQPDTVETRSLQFFTEERRKLVDRQTSESQRLTGWLKQVWPRMLDWFDNPASPLVGDLLSRRPSLQALQKASAATLRNSFLRITAGVRNESSNVWTGFARPCPLPPIQPYWKPPRYVFRIPSVSGRSRGPVSPRLTAPLLKLTALIPTALIPAGPSWSRSPARVRPWNPASSLPPAPAGPFRVSSQPGLL